jgi:hypothetical protein
MVVSGIERLEEGRFIVAVGTPSSHDVDHDVRETGLQNAFSSFNKGAKIQAGKAPAARQIASGSRR